MIYVLDERSGRIETPPTASASASASSSSISSRNSRRKNPYSSKGNKKVWCSPFSIIITSIAALVFVVWWVTLSNTSSDGLQREEKQQQNKNVAGMAPASSASSKDKAIDSSGSKVFEGGVGAMGIVHEIEEYFHLKRLHGDRVAAATQPKDSSAWEGIQSAISSHGDGRRFLIGWPTIPTSHKGSDSRAIDAIIFLTSIGYSVDLIYWRDYAAEVKFAWDDTEDRERLLNAGVRRILGPYEYKKLSESHTFISSYFAFMFWLWPDGPYLECVHDFVNHIMRHNGSTRIMAAVDDTGIAVRNLYASRARADITTDAVERFLLQRKRHPDLVGVDEYSPPHSGVTASLTDEDFISLRSPVYLFHLEMYLYAMSDVTIGLNDHIAQFLSAMVPGTPSKVLSYISPIQPRSDVNAAFSARQKDYIFFGYNNPANKGCIENFVNYIMHLVDQDARFHIAGVVTYHIPQFCRCTNTETSSDCTPLMPSIICHGDLNDEQLESLILSVRVAINPVMEPSGVATKTCRAMAYGTPVVVSTLDGTFNANSPPTDGATRCDINDAPCTANAINLFLNDPHIWTKASTAAKAFITHNYGSAPYANDWLHILTTLYYDRKVQVLIDGDAQKDGQSMSAQNWNIAHILTSQYSNTLEVTVMGDLSPSIQGVHQVKTPLHDFNTPMPLTKEQSGGLDMEYLYYPSPFLTGYTPHILLRQKWPPNPHPFPLKYCSLKCRIIQILPWEFGSLPKKWIKPLTKYADVLSAPSHYNRQIFLNSGYDMEKTTVLPAGVDCDVLLPMSKLRATTLSTSNTNNNPVLFIFSGALLPRKGVDIILQEFHNVFCTPDNTNNNYNVKLILQTSYELGYDTKEKASFDTFVQQCSSVGIVIDLQRNHWIKRSSEHKDFLKTADVYAAPFRSEGFGLPIVEALLLGLRVIVSTGGTSADDFTPTTSSISNTQKGNNNMIYSVPSHEVTCTHEPCSTTKEKKQLCVFPPCWDTGKDNIWKCTCETLVNEPTWFEVDRELLRKQILKAYDDVQRSRTQTTSKTNNQVLQTKEEDGLDEKDPKQFCWSNLSSTYKNKFTSILKSPIQRRDTSTIDYFFIEPDKYRLQQIEHKDYIQRMTLICTILVTSIMLCLLVLILRLRPKQSKALLVFIYGMVISYTPVVVKKLCYKGLLCVQNGCVNFKNVFSSSTTTTSSSITISASNTKKE